MKGNFWINYMIDTRVSTQYMDKNDTTTKKVNVKRQKINLRGHKNGYNKIGYNLNFSFN